MNNNFMTDLKNNRYVGGVEGFLKQNGSTISMVAGFVTLGLTIWRAYKASSDIAKIQADYESGKKKIAAEGLSEDEKRVKIKELKTERNTKSILAYKWVLLFGSSTLGLMLLSQYLNGIAFTALAGYAMKEEDKVKQFVKKGKEVLGEDKFKEVEDGILEDKIKTANQPCIADQLSTASNEGVLVADSITGLVSEFKSLDDVKDALTGGEKYWSRNHGISFEKFLQNTGFNYSAANTDPTERSLGWDANNPLITSLDYSKYKAAQVLTIFYTNQPKPMNISALNK